MNAAEYARLLDATLDTVIARLEEAHLPLHILLSSPFGELNENQEEMLDAARQAVDTADVDVRRLKKLVEVDRGAVPIMPQPISMRELLRPSLAIAGARAVAAHVQLDARISDALRRAIVDPVHAQEALTAILLDVVAHANPGGDVTVRASDGTEDEVPRAPSRRVRMTIARNPGSIDMTSIDASLELRLARRLIEAQGGAVYDADGALVIELPSEAL